MEYVLIVAMAMAGWQIPGVVCVFGGIKVDVAASAFSAVWMGLLGTWIVFG